MGALHNGHLNLIKQAKQQQSKNTLVVVSIFVNPLQFGPNEDFDRYPRNLKEDLEKLKELADCVFTPEIKNIIGKEELIKMDAGPVSKVLEGKTRPSYFDGVLTIVAKLFNIVQPDVALFGKKDAQQVGEIKGIFCIFVLVLFIKFILIFRNFYSDFSDFFGYYSLISGIFYSILIPLIPLLLSLPLLLLGYK